MTIQPSNDTTREPPPARPDKRPCTLYVLRSGPWAFIGVTNKGLDRLAAFYARTRPDIAFMFSTDCTNEGQGFGMLYDLHGAFSDERSVTGWYPYESVRRYLHNARQRGSAWVIGGNFYGVAVEPQEAGNDREFS